MKKTFQPTEKKQQQESTSPWGGQKMTRHQKKTLEAIRPLKPAAMAAALVKTHGKEYALRQIIEPCAVSSFRDRHGVPVTANPSSNYWNEVKKAVK